MERILKRGPGTAFALGAVLLSAGILALLGLLVILSVSAVPEDMKGLGLYHRATKQAGWIAVAAVTCFVVARVDYGLLAKASKPLLAVTWVLLVLALFFSEQLGARRWIDLGPASLQPSEIAKITLLLFCAEHLRRRQGALDSFRRTVAPALLAVLGTVGLVIIEPDLGTSVFLFAVAMTVLVVGGLGLKYLVPVALVSVPAFVVFVATSHAYVTKRLHDFMGSGKGTHVDTALVALASGGLFGRGLGEGRSQLFFLPMVHNDFIMASIGEQFGFVGSAAVVFLYLTILWQGLRIAYRAEDPLGFSIAFGAAFMLALQAAVNLAVVTGTAPAKGISLPFVSYGGSSLLVSATALGLLAGVARKALLAERAARAGGDVGSIGPEPSAPAAHSQRRAASGLPLKVKGPGFPVAGSLI